MGALGVIAEDYLTQVYETLIRDVAPRGKTLGQLYDALHAEVRAIFRKEPPKPADLNVLYEKIGTAIRDVEAGDARGAARSLEIMRDFVSALKTERIYNQEMVRQLRDHDVHANVFPLTMRDNFNELIRYRNAAAHKTRVPLGNYEALRTLYSLVSFVMWWQETISNIDWRADRDSILAGFIERAK